MVSRVQELLLHPTFDVLGLDGKEQHSGYRQLLYVFERDHEKIDLVITDLTMPDMTGEKLSQELIKIKPDLPIILCTGFSELMSTEKAASLGIKDFLLKPVIMKDLALAVRKVLD